MSHAMILHDVEEQTMTAGKQAGYNAVSFYFKSDFVLSQSLEVQIKILINCTALVTILMMGSFSNKLDFK